ncbi:MAG: neutral/alkaline non-lysosomal ceramidase N-terminal domain-containing protein [bacterium]|nr:neutral/alkaline non-lysosomal ceramidase N-terminal domain-containing protein [bacterium]
MLIAGVSKCDITPPTWVPYLTSSGNGTCAPFEGVHDSLYARVLVLDDGQQAIAVLAVDSIGYDNAVLGLGRNFTQELRARIEEKTGLDGAAVMLSATHSHSTPETIGLTNFREFPGVPEWVETHLENLVDAVVQAWENRVPVRAYAGSTEVTGVARYRRVVMKDGTLDRRGASPPEEQVAIPWRLDEELSVLYFETEEGAPHAVLANYTAHPVVAMLLPPASADYPGALTAGVEAALDGVVCLFVNGACANVNSVHVTTNFEDVAELGGKLAQGALEEIERLKAGAPLVDPGVSVRVDETVLEPRPCLSVEEAERAVEADSSAENLRTLRLARKLAEGPIRAEVQAMGLGPVRWVALPGEVFVETGLALKEQGASFVVGNANGWVGYLPIRRAYDEGGYEVGPGAWSRVAPGSAEKMEALAGMLLDRL